MSKNQGSVQVGLSFGASGRYLCCSWRFCRAWSVCQRYVPEMHNLLLLFILKIPNRLNARPTPEPVQYSLIQRERADTHRTLTEIFDLHVRIGPGGLRAVFLHTSHPYSGPMLVTFSSHTPLVAKAAAEDEPVHVLQPSLYPLLPCRSSLRLGALLRLHIPASETAIRTSILVLRPGQSRGLIIRKCACHHPLLLPRRYARQSIVLMYLPLRW